MKYFVTPRQAHLSKLAPFRPSPLPMRKLLPAALGCLAFAALAQQPDTPLKEYPYSPGLDPGSMDRSVDPCVDFYKYSCGGWIAKNPIPADQPKWEVYSKLNQDNLRFL